MPTHNTVNALPAKGKIGGIYYLLTKAGKFSMHIVDNYGNYKDLDNSNDSQVRTFRFQATDSDGLSGYSKVSPILSTVLSTFWKNSEILGMIFIDNVPYEPVENGIYITANGDINISSIGGLQEGQKLLATLKSSDILLTLRFVFGSSVKPGYINVPVENSITHPLLKSGKILGMIFIDNVPYEPVENGIELSSDGKLELLSVSEIQPDQKLVITIQT